MPVRLQKRIADVGIDSRRHAEDLIRLGRIEVNGVVVTKLGTKVDVNDHVRVDGKLIGGLPPKVYLLLNKPRGYITSLHDPEGRPTVMDLIKGVLPRVYPVGRLDYDTEGLLVLTNDGVLSEALMHPRNQVKKTYHAKVKGRPSQEKLTKIARGGISLVGGRTAPCRVRRIRETERATWVEIVLHEGKTGQVRNIMKKVGHPVEKLRRVGYGCLERGNHPLGHYRYLTETEVKRLYALTKRKLDDGKKVSG